MESIISTTGNVSVASDGPLSQKLKKKRRKSRKSKAENEQLIESEKDYLYTPKLHFVSKPECKILYKNIKEEFIKWLKWQRLILICGLTDKCSKSLLRTMGTVVEPVLHKSFNGTAVLFIEMKEQENQMISRRTTQTPLVNASCACTRSINSSHVDLDSNNQSLVVTSQELSNMTAVNNGEPFLPPIDSSKISIVEKSTESHEKNWWHKHCDKDEIQSAPSRQFFPDIMISRSTGLGKICVAKNLRNFETIDQNYTSKLFKNRKWWSLSATSSSFLVPNGKKLLDNFKSHLDVIYKWFSEWKDAEQGACILELLSVCQLDEIEYFSQCILQRLKDRADINRLPDHIMKNIFDRLSANDLLSTALVCKRWRSLSEDQQLWKDKCHSLCRRNDIPNVVKEIEMAANGQFIDWKQAYRDLSLKIQERNARMEELKMLATDEISEYEDDDTESLDSFGLQATSTTFSSTDEYLSIDKELSDDDVSSVVSGMTDFLNGDLGIIEDTVNQLSAQTKRAESRREEDDVAFDIRPEVSIQAANKLASISGIENLFKFVNVDGVRMLKRVRKLQDHLDAVLTLQFDKKRVITGSADRTARLWDVRSGRSIHKFKGHKGGVRAVCFDKEYIITGSWDSTIIIWSAVKFTRLKTLDEHNDCVSCLEMNDDFMVSGSHDRTVRIWTKHTWNCYKILKGHHGCVTCLCIVDNNRILTGGMDRVAKLWNINDESCMQSFSGSSDTILTIKSYGDLIAAGSHDGDLLFWDINSGNCEGIIVGHTGPLYCISFYGTRFVTGGGDQLVKEWDLSTCSCVRSFTGHKDAVLCVQFSSRRIVSGSADGTIRIWDMSNRMQ